MKSGALVQTLRSGNPRVSHFAPVHECHVVTDAGAAPLGYLHSDEFAIILEVVYDGWFVTRGGPAAKIITNRGLTGWTMCDNLEVVR